MYSPIAALTWELWRRHRTHLVTLALTLLAFALFYAKLCALAGLNLASPNVLDDIVTIVPAMEHLGGTAKIFRIGSLLFLLLGPITCMAMSLLYVIWIFTFTGFDPKRPFAFPRRLFTLPVSTTFLSGGLMVSGVASLFMVYLAWTRMVPFPHMDIFDAFAETHGVFGWLMLQVLVQAVVWSLGAFPFMRLMALSLVVYCFVGYPSLEPDNFLRQQQPWLFSTLLVAAAAVGHTGLVKSRQGQWQQWSWHWRFSSSPTAGLQGPRTFRSPAEAQQWFEWRSYGRKLFLTTCVLLGIPIVLVTPEVMLHGPLDGETTFSLCVYLLSIPLFIHFCHGINFKRTLAPFIALRPQTNGELAMAEWKTVAQSTVLSWVAAGIALATLSLLGDVPGAALEIKSLVEDPQFVSLLPVMLLGLIFLTWRFAVVNLCFTTMGRAWMSQLPVFTAFGSIAVYLEGNYLAQFPEYRETLFRALVCLLVMLLVAKGLIAQWAFRTAIQRQLLARPAMKQYLLLWAGLAVLFLAPVLLILPHQRAVLPLCLAIIALLPLARIGFAPIALAFGRHR
jgi:hypothetical protein